MKFLIKVLQTSFVITNNEKEEVLVSVEVTKIWKDSDGKILVDLAGKSAKVELYKNGAATGQELNLDENNAFFRRIYKSKIK